MVDNHQLFGKSKIGTRSAVKNSTRVISKNRSQSADEEDELDAELSRLMIENSVFAIYNC